MTLFSFLTGNADMHLKNFSLIYPLKKLIQFAPAYDLLATRLLRPEQIDPDDSALAINGKRRKLNRDDFHALAKHLGISERPLKSSYRGFQKKLGLALDSLEKSVCPRKPGKSLGNW